ncbi:hypothetical protein ACLOJK_006216 [Asimina triloba]
MASGKQASSGGLEWRLQISDGQSRELVPEMKWGRRAWRYAVELMVGLRMGAWRVMERMWKLGADDPRRVVHSIKVGLALTMVSFFYYLRPLYDGVGGNAMWAVMTVVVVFEFSVGATLSKGLNRGMATLLAGSLAIGVHELAQRSGDKAQPIVLGISVFLLASTATFSRFIPTIKARFDYGVSVFILTFSLVTVSGYRVDKLLELAHQRLSTIAIGGSLCMLISMLLCPVWAGEDLHLLTTRNMEKLANSLDGCMDEQFSEKSGNTTEDEVLRQKQHGYKCILNSKATEESLANFARWEPAHGHFGFRHPWQQYLKIGAALRFCAYSVEGLRCSINPDTTAPGFIKNHLSDPCMRLSSHASAVLKELVITTKTMRKSSTIDSLLEEMNEAVEDLQNALRSLPQQLPPPATAQVEKSGPISAETVIQLMEVLPIITAASLLIEVSARIGGVIDEVNELARIADFKPAKDDKPKSNVDKSSEEQGQEAMKAVIEPGEKKSLLACLRTYMDLLFGFAALNDSSRGHQLLSIWVGLTLILGHIESRNAIHSTFVF